MWSCRIDQIGDMPDPAATSTMGPVRPSRRKQVPKGPRTVTFAPTSMPPASSSLLNFPSGYFLMMNRSFWAWSGVFAMENERVISSPSLVLTVMSTYCPAQNLIGVSMSISMARMSCVRLDLAVIFPLKSLTAMDFDSSSSSKFSSSMVRSSCAKERHSKMPP
eukprot:Amastigsp_a180002_6.p2 type:complete len:163 gc:universal Amastigsp_a180002_6:1173-685(-)